MGKKVTKAIAIKEPVKLEVVPGNIKIIVQKFQRWNGIFALFHSETYGWVNVDELPTICLSRKKPGECNFRVDLLHLHDYHAPAFKTEEDCDEYIKRVLDDITGSKLGGIEVSIEIRLVEKPIDAEFTVQ